MLWSVCNPFLPSGPIWAAVHIQRPGLEACWVTQADRDQLSLKELVGDEAVQEDDGKCKEWWVMQTTATEALFCWASLYIS